MAEAMTPFFVGPGGERTSEDGLKRRRKIAEALMLSGSNYSPVSHWAQGLARMAQGLVGGYQAGEIAREEQAAMAEQAGRNALLTGADPTSFAGAPSAPVATVSAAGFEGAPPAVPATPAALAPVFTTKEAEYKLPTNYLPQVANIESRFDPNAANPKSSARGLFQFTKGTARDYGLANPMDPLASTDAAARLAADNSKTLTRALGRAPSAGELYLAHQQGGGGASKLLANPGARAIDVVGRRAVLDNGGHEGMSAGDFAKLWTRKVAQNDADLPAEGAIPAAMETGQPGFAVPQGQTDVPMPIMQEGGALPNFDPASGRWLGPDTQAKAFTEQGAPQGSPAMAAQYAEQGAPQGGPAVPTPLAPSFTAEGVTQPWMGSAPASPGVKQVAQALSATTPPRRSAELALANPEADMPAPGAVQAMGQLPPQTPALPDLSNTNDGGMRQLQVASEEASRGLPSGANAVSPINRIVQALMGNGQTAPTSAASPNIRRLATALQGSEAQPSAPATSTGVANVAAAVTSQSSAPAPSSALSGPTTAQPTNARLQAAYATLNSPYARPGERALAQGIIQQSLKGAEFETLTRPDGSVYRVPKAGGAPVQVFGPQSKPEGPTGDMREYDLHVAQEKAAGRQPESFTDWARGNKAAGRTAINIDTKGAGKFAEKANEHQAKRYSDMRTAADEGVALRGDIEVLSSLLEGIGTGRGAEAKLGIAQMAKGMGLDSVADWLTSGKINEMEAAQSVMDRLTPRMRVPGSGATSDMEMRTFRNSIPSLGRQPGGNRIIGDTFRSMLDQQAMAGDIAGKALRGEIDQAEADKMLKELPSPFARFKEYQKGQDEAAKAAKGGTAAPPAAQAPAARKSVGGKSYVKRGTEWFEE